MSTSRVYTVGQVLTAAQVNDLPQGILGKTVLTANAGPTSGTTELDVITAPAVTIAMTTRRLRIRVTARGLIQTVGGDTFTLRIKEGATVLSEYILTSNATNVAQGFSLEAIVDSPTAASHTYKASVTRALGTGTGTVEATASAPFTITVEDVGQV